MSDGIKVYVTKYVEPSAQLYKSERVDFVKKFEDTLRNLYTKREALISGDNADVEKYIALYSKNEEDAEAIRKAVETGENVFAEEDITNAEIASIIGLTEKQTADIRTALAKNDTNVLNMYNDKLVRTRVDMKETYPVRENIAVAIAENPNILEDLKARYNIEDLMTKRARIQTFAAYKLNEETGEIETTEALNNIQTNLNKEIELQNQKEKNIFKHCF